MLKWERPKRQAVSSKSCVAADAAFEEVLHPAAEEELFGNCDEEEGEEIGCGDLGEARPVWVEVQEAEAEAEGESYRDVEDALAQADAEVAKTEAEIEADAV